MICTIFFFSNFSKKNFQSLGLSEISERMIGRTRDRVEMRVECDKRDK